MKKSAPKRKIEEIAEEIDYMGQDSEDKAVKYVQEVDKRHEEESTQEYNDSLNLLDMKRKSPSYSDMLVEEAASFMLGFDIPQGFLWGVKKTSKGIVFWYRSPDKKIFASGNKISLIPEYDMNGVVRKTFKMLDQMDMWVERHEKKEDTAEIILK